MQPVPLVSSETETLPHRIRAKENTALVRHASRSARGAPLWISANMSEHNHPMGHDGASLVCLPPAF